MKKYKKIVCAYSGGLDTSVMIPWLKEHYNAEIAKITAATQMEELVSAEQVKKESFRLGRSIREQLANLADRLSNELAGESDPAVIHKVLTNEHRQCLMEIAKIA